MHTDGNGRANHIIYGSKASKRQKAGDNCILNGEEHVLQDISQ